ncbi:MAG: carboxypeptidase regulatory-like domain-containing protein [Myxococcales bacterium]|nr:carboxypeptidase regulatory-like domain-containing protein [Myxococcales bacterium]
MEPTSGRAVALSMAVMSGCGSAHGSEELETAKPEVGVVEGVVRLDASSELPAYARLGDDNQPEPPRQCSPAKKTDLRPVSLSESRGLGGMIVGATGFSEGPPVPRRVHEVTLRDCRLEPRVIAATRGDAVRMTNLTDYPFLPQFGRGQLMQTLLKDETRDIPLAASGVLRLGCGFAAPCGSVDVAVFNHGLHAVTDTEGRFRIEGVPANEDVEIHVWHPLFDKAVQKVRLKKGEVKRLEFTARPPKKTDEPQTVLR